ncbi:hypothetical protein H3V53_40355 [Paraburkholderia bengalensis]|uniref:Uncharacterized protein n=1 Tax=Paraburkholderia bengalensis TaxID=2747562 RepID=A0ABU8J5S4_9BURK
MNGALLQARRDSTHVDAGEMERRRGRQRDLDGSAAGALLRKERAFLIRTSNAGQAYASAGVRPMHA